MELYTRHVLATADADPDQWGDNWGPVDPAEIYRRVLESAIEDIHEDLFVYPNGNCYEISMNISHDDEEKDEDYLDTLKERVNTVIEDIGIEDLEAEMEEEE